MKSTKQARPTSSPKKVNCVSEGCGRMASGRVTPTKKTVPVLCNSKVTGY